MTLNRERIAGGPDDFMEVVHLTVDGSQVEIGRALAAEARQRYGWTPVPADPTMARARRAWFERHWPQHHARMRGAAEAIGVDLERDQVHLDGQSWLPEGSGCSATWCPPSTTAEGHGLVGRNYDFFTIGWGELFALLAGESGPEKEPPMSSRPYVVTTVPDDGPATTVITMSELDGCTEGINEHGLAVVMLLADAESASAPIAAGPQVGLGSLQLPRFVLETCENVEQAKRALLNAKQYDLGIPLHYLIADSSGHAFVWEHSRGGVEHIVEVDSGPLCVTNHMLHEHPDPQNLPQDNEETMLTYQRLATLSKRTEGETMSAAGVRDALDEVRYDARIADKYPLRTLWRTVFDLDDRTMASHFYLGDASDGVPRYSAEAAFRPR